MISFHYTDRETRYRLKLTHYRNRGGEDLIDNMTAFHSDNGKRRILIVEDEAVNRAILGGILEQDYEVLYAGDGLEALEAVRENKGFLSLVIPDLIMPNMPGLEVLCRIKAEPGYQALPVIVASGDQSSEIECLNCGASDFIQKPYPEPGVILARVRGTIELFEGRQIIESTERDHLTGRRWPRTRSGTATPGILAFTTTRCTRPRCTPCS